MSNLGLYSMLNLENLSLWSQTVAVKSITRSFKTTFSVVECDSFLSWRICIFTPSMFDCTLSHTYFLHPSYDTYPPRRRTNNSRANWNITVKTLQVKHFIDVGFWCSEKLSISVWLKMLLRGSTNQRGWQHKSASLIILAILDDNVLTSFSSKTFSFFSICCPSKQNSNLA